MFIIILQLRSMCRALEGLAHSSEIDLSVTRTVPAEYAHLRYPILIGEKCRRDTKHYRMRKAGLAASVMYSQALQEIESVRAHINDRGILPFAHEFAGRLLTLPTHNDVADSTVGRITNFLRH